MNLLIILGAFFTVFTFFGAASGYILLFLGLMELRPIREISLAKNLVCALAILELARSFLPLPDSIATPLYFLATALPIYAFYLLIKAQYMWKPNRANWNFLRRFTVIGSLYLLFFTFNILTGSLGMARIVISSTFYTFLFYVLFHHYLKNPQRKRLKLSRSLPFFSWQKR